jgi:hypothetical protein
MASFVDSGAAYRVKFGYKAAINDAALRQLLVWLLEARTSPISPAKLVERNPVLDVLDLPWSKVCRFLAKEPHRLQTFDPRAFERLVAEIFRSSGWSVELTARTRDGGYDVIAVRRDQPTAFRVLAEAKRYSPEHPVGVQIVRALYGVRSLNAVSQVVLATTSRVSDAAKKEFARVIPWELDFIERDAILSWCRRYPGVELSGDFRAETGA